MLCISIPRGYCAWRHICIMVEALGVGVGVCETVFLHYIIAKVVLGSPLQVPLHRRGVCN